MCKPRSTERVFYFQRQAGAGNNEQEFLMAEKEAESMEEVARLLAEKLAEKGVTPEQVKEGLQHEVVVEHVARWLMNPPQEFPCI